MSKNIKSQNNYQFQDLKSFNIIDTTSMLNLNHSTSSESLGEHNEKNISFTNKNSGQKFIYPQVNNNSSLSNNHIFQNQNSNEMDYIFEIMQSKMNKNENK